MLRSNIKIYISAGIIGPIFYFVLLTLLGFMWVGYNPISTGMSEIGAVDSPFQQTMNYLGFSLLGLFLIIFSIGFKLYFKNNFQLVIAFLLILLGGISMFLIGFFPCDSKCIDVTMTGKIHSILSTISAIAIPLAAIFSAYPISKKWNKRWGYISFYLGVLSIASGPLMFIASFNNFSGLIQRLGIGFSLLWIMLISFKIKEK